MNNVVDEILQDDPKFRIIDDEGNIIYDNISIEMITAINQIGTALNKALFDSIKNDLNSRLLITSKATQAESNAGTNDTKYLTPLKLKNTLLNGYIPSKQMSIKQGTIAHGSAIPQTSGYSNYLYFVSMNSFTGYDGMSDGTTVCLRWQCDVNQNTRIVNARQKIYVTSALNPSHWSDWSGTSSKGTNVSGVANYIEIAWN